MFWVPAGNGGATPVDTVVAFEEVGPKFDVCSEELSILLMQLLSSNHNASSDMLISEIWDTASEWSFSAKSSGSFLSCREVTRELKACTTLRMAVPLADDVLRIAFSESSYM
jgi:hypothetical protein